MYTSYSTELWIGTGVFKQVKEPVVRNKSWSTCFAEKKSAAQTAFDSFVEGVEKIG